MKRHYLAVAVMLLLSVFLAGCGCGGSDVGLVSIAVTPADSSIIAGTTQAFIATGTYSDNTTQDITTQVTWSSSDPGVATISNATGSEGRAAGIKAGSVTITATSGNISGTAALTVLPVLVSITVTPDNQSISVGATQQYTATGTYSDGSSQDITLAVVWSSSSSPAGVVAVSNLEGSKGLATALAAGSATISAASGAISGSAGLTVNPVIVAPVLVSIAVAPSNQILAIGATQQYTATGTYSDGTSKDITSAVVWSTSSTPAGVAVVSNVDGSKGLVTAIAAGSATISATSGSISGSAGLTVNPAVPPVTLVSIKVTPENPWVGFGKTLQFTATGTFSDNSTRDITQEVVWSSSKTDIATISNDAGSKGLATTDHKIGLTVITATSGSISGSTTLFDP